MKDAIPKGLKKYDDLVKKGGKIDRLEKNMAYVVTK